MTLKINHQKLLQTLISAGASHALPVKATKAQVDKVWIEAQANPWFFEVNEHGTLVDPDIPEPHVWGDVFDITTSETTDIKSLIREIQACPPLSAHMDGALDDEIESIKEDLDSDYSKSSEEKKSLKEKISTLKRFCDEYEEPWQDWIELEGKNGIAKFNALIEDWLTDPIDWTQSDHFPMRSGPRGVALGFFEDQEYALLDALGVVIVDGEHPGSSYYAAELRNDIDDANVTAERLGLPFRFKKHVVPADDKPAAPPWQPSKLALAIFGPDNLDALRQADHTIQKHMASFGQAPLTGEAAAIVNNFILSLPKVTGYIAGMSRGMKGLKLRQSVKLFAEQRGRFPDADELEKIWNAI